MNFKHVLKPNNVSAETRMKFIVPNPKYYDALKRDASTRFINATEKLSSGDYFPFGSLYLDGYSDTLPAGNTSIELRPLQVPVFNEVKHEKGALVYAKTGSGKTVLTTALHEAWGGTMLVVVHSLDNVKYFNETFNKFINVDTGMVCTGSKTLKRVTVTTFNTFRSKHKAFAAYKHENGDVGFENLMIDEADAFFTKKARDAINVFPAKRKMAFTGTKKTPYDEHMPNADKTCLEMFYGKLVVAGEDESKDPLDGVFYREYTNDYKTIVPNAAGEDVWVPLKSYEWHDFRKELDGDLDRKRAQWNYIMENTVPTEQTLVLFDRVSDVEAFYSKASKAGILCHMNHGSLKKADRENTLDSFYRLGGYCFAQYRTMGRGYDNDKLTKVFILFPTKGENNIRQIVGRVIRWLDGKKSYVYTWYDSGLRKQHTTRVQVFKEFFNQELIMK